MADILHSPVVVRCGELGPPPPEYRDDPVLVAGWEAGVGCNQPLSGEVAVEMTLEGPLYFHPACAKKHREIMAKFEPGGEYYGVF